MSHLLILGAGAAGTAAAYHAHARGLRVTVVHAAPGSTALSSGAFDIRPWDSPGPARALSESGQAFLERLGYWRSATNLRLATLGGRLRPAYACDPRLLNWSAMPQGALIVVPRVNRPNWDADLLCRALAEPAAALGLRVEARDANLLLKSDEVSITDSELAARWEANPDWVGAQLHACLSSGASAGGLLLGPWLGLQRSLAPELSAGLGCSVGEVVCTIGSSAGPRFEAARDQLLGSLGIATDVGWVDAVVREGNGWVLRTESPHREWRGDGLLLACGGIASGGVVFHRPDTNAGEDLPPTLEPSLRMGIAIEGMTMSLDGDRPLDLGGSIHGADIERHAWPQPYAPALLQTAGVWAPNSPSCGEHLWVAGDARAGRARTTGEAVESAIAAVELAARALTQ